MSTDTATHAPEVPIWARLHLARFMAGMEVKELAAKTGISRNTIHNYESGDWDRKRNPAYIRLWALATGIDYQWLSGGVPNSPDGERHLHRDERQSTGFGRVVLNASHRFRPQREPLPRTG